MSNQTLNEMQITLRSKKANKEVMMHFGDLPEASQAAIIRYGAMRFINDKLGGLEPKEAGETFEKVLAQLQKGWVDQRGQGGGGNKTLDPVEKEMETMAWNRIKEILKTKGIPLKAIEKDKKQQLIGEMLEKYEKELRPKAEAIVKARNTQLDMDSISLDGLGIEGDE